MKSLLHVGCGPASIKDLPGYFQNNDWQEIRLDIDEGASPDIVASILDMGLIEDGSIDALFSSHNIEHVYSHEVPVVLAEFSRVLSTDGVAVIRCPDIQSVAAAVASGALLEPLYDSAAGPIAAIDIMYGLRSAVAAGNHFMAHKTAFTARSLASALLEAGFVTVRVARDAVYGLHALAYKFQPSDALINELAAYVFPVPDSLINLETFVSSK